MGHLSYSESKQKALKIIIILAVITICEVLFALLGKGYLIEGVHFPLYLMGLVMIAMSLYKAYLIVYEFMHMKYEVPGLVRSVLLPTLLLGWAIIAFFSEANAWRTYRANTTAVEERIEIPEANKKEIKGHETDSHDDHGESHDDHGH